MSMRPLIDPYLVIPNAAGSPANSQNMTLTLTSAPTIMRGLSMVSYEFVWSGTAPVGTVALQMSNDYSLNADGTVKNAGHWVARPLTDSTGATVTSLPLSGNTGEGMIDVAATGSYAVRVVYTPTSGTGTLSVTLNAKVA